MTEECLFPELAEDRGLVLEDEGDADPDKNLDPADDEDGEDDDLDEDEDSDDIDDLDENGNKKKKPVQRDDPFEGK